MIKTVILGNGNVGTHLCQAFEKNDQIALLQNYNRKNEAIANCQVPVTSDTNSIVNAEVYILAFNDAALENLTPFHHLNGLVVHTSGGTDMKVLKNFTNHGVFYPAQSFTKSIPVDFKNVPFAVEANSVLSEKILLHLAGALSKQVYAVNSQQRLALHTAAVFANNFTNFLFTKAQEICQQHQLDFKLLLPLINNSVNKLKHQTPDKLQTGPAIRKDQNTIENHLQLLETDSQKNIYQLLTNEIQNYYGKKL